MHNVVRTAFILLWCGIAFSEVLRVPQEFVTIQSALNNTGAGDTVEVSEGHYAEALVAPPHFLFLRGIYRVEQDSVIRPRIDPSPLIGSDTMACLTLPEDSKLRVEWLAFANGAEMLRGRSELRVGGIAYFTSDTLWIKNCLFDSVFQGIAPGARLSYDIRPRVYLEHCEFLDATYNCGVLQGPSIVSRCLFHGTMNGGFGVFDSSLVEECVFRGTSELGLFGAVRGHNVIRRNTFGPAVTEQDAVLIYSRYGNDSLIENVFDVTEATRVLSIAVREGEPVYCAHNLFTGVFTSGQTGSLIGFQEDGFHSPGLHLRFEDNVIEDMEQPFLIKALAIATVDCGLEARGNRFEDLGGTGVTIKADSNAYLHSLNFNRFQETGNAVWNYSTFALDARMNWWGDSTGPYHAQLNALGGGDTLIGLIDFDPWLTDTSLWSGIETERIDMPSEFRMTAFPNPTNATVSILISAPRQTEVELKLFNILGREIETLWNGKVEGFKSLNFGFSDAATGIYFVRAVDEQNATLAMQKIMLLK